MHCEFTESFVSSSLIFSTRNVKSYTVRSGFKCVLLQNLLHLMLIHTEKFDLDFYFL